MSKPLESTHLELSFEWSHLQVSLDSSGFNFLAFVKFAFGSERKKTGIESTRTRRNLNEDIENP